MSSTSFRGCPQSRAASERSRPTRAHLRGGPRAATDRERRGPSRLSTSHISDVARRRVRPASVGPRRATRPASVRPRAARGVRRARGRGSRTMPSPQKFSILAAKKAACGLRRKHRPAEPNSCPSILIFQCTSRGRRTESNAARMTRNGARTAERRVVVRRYKKRKGEAEEDPKQRLLARRPRRHLIPSRGRLRERSLRGEDRRGVAARLRTMYVVAAASPRFIKGLSTS